MGSEPRSGERSLKTIVAVDPEDLAEKAAALLLTAIRTALSARNGARVALSGGSTPRKTYRLLARGLFAEKLPMDRIDWFFGDERWVPVSSPESNEGMARETLLDAAAAPAGTIHSWGAPAGDPRDCARRYARAILGDRGDESPVFDLVVLGMGADGHTASLFPDAVAHLSDGRILPIAADLPGDAAAVELPRSRGWRLTLCPNMLQHCRTVAFLVTGADKATALRRARAGDLDTPAAWIRGDETFFIVTRETMSSTGTDGALDVRHA